MIEVSSIQIKNNLLLLLIRTVQTALPFSFSIFKLGCLGFSIKRVIARIILSARGILRLTNFLYSSSNRFDRTIVIMDLFCCLSNFFKEILQFVGSGYTLRMSFLILFKCLLFKKFKLYVSVQFI